MLYHYTVFVERVGALSHTFHTSAAHADEAIAKAEQAYGIKATDNYSMSVGSEPGPDGRKQPKFISGKWAAGYSFRAKRGEEVTS